MIREQNVQAPAGQIGQPPSAPGQSFQYSLRVQGRLVTPEEFANIIVGSKPDGSFVRLRDIGRVELGAATYNYATQLDGQPAVVMAIYLAPGANALETAELVKAQLGKIRGGFPIGLDLKIMYDTSEFVNASIEEVIHTFVEALILVLIVVFLFLQSWRATLIPMLAVPVSLVATFAAYRGARLQHQHAVAVRDGARDRHRRRRRDRRRRGRRAQHAGASSCRRRRRRARRWTRCQGPVVAIALVLAAVFVPMAFIPGVTGQLYKQFALTVAVSTMFSALVALDA